MRRKTALIIYLVITLLVGFLACAIFFIPDLPFELPVYRTQQIHATISAPSGSSSETVLSPTAIPEQYPDN